jgi:hypothetical protein
LTPLCITGSAHGLSTLLGALQPLGLSLAKPLARDHKVNLQNWHQRVLEAANPTPSRVWQQLAADLLLENIEAPQWAWADANALPLLDFWAGFDDSIRFVLVAETPAQTLLRQPQNNTPHQLLTHWSQLHQTLLRFVLRQPERCLLVWSQQAQQDPQALAKKMVQRWNLGLNTHQPVPAPTPDSNNPTAEACILADHLAQHLCQQHPQVHQLLSDLQACVEPLGISSPLNPTHNHTGNSPYSQQPDPALLLTRYQTLADRSAQAAQLPSLKQSLQAQTAKTTEIEKSKAAAQAELAHSQAAHLATQEQLKAAETQVQAAQTQLKAAQAIAATLPALQKELQAQTAKTAEAEKNSASTQAALNKAQAELKAAQAIAATLPALQKELQAQTAKTAETEKNSASAQAALNKAQAELKEAGAESELLLSQLHAVQEELESHFLRNQELQTQGAESEKARSAAQADLSKTQAALKASQEQLKTAQDQAKAAQASAAALQKDLHAQSAKTAETETARATAQAQLGTTQGQLKESQEESELLLNQLHVVQEELENYYYRNKELQAQAQALTTLQQRWGQLFATHPNLFAADSVVITPLPPAEGQAQHFSCTLDSLHMAGRHFEQLHATLVLQADHSATLQLTRPSQGSGALQRWPRDTAPGATLNLNPKVTATDGAQRIATYMQLSTSDWQLVQDLPRLLLTAVQAAPTTLSAEQQTALTQALQQHDTQLGAFKRMLRFDHAQLTQDATPQRLALQLQQTSHDSIHSPSLQLALSQSASATEPASAPNITLDIGPSPLFLPHSTLSLQLGSQGWHTPETAPLGDALRLRINALVSVLPLTLQDAVANGANKDSLTPWAQLCPQLRAWSQLSHTPQTAQTAQTAQKTRTPKAPAQHTAPTAAAAKPAPATRRAAVKPSAAAAPKTQPATTPAEPTAAPVKPRAAQKTTPSAAPLKPATHAAAKQAKAAPAAAQVTAQAPDKPKAPTPSKAKSAAAAARPQAPGKAHTPATRPAKPTPKASLRRKETA